MSKAELQKSKQLRDRLIKTVSVQNPTQAQLAELRNALENIPELLDALGYMSSLIRDKIILAMAPQPGLQIVIGEQAQQMAKELGAEQASFLERLLIEQVVIAWLRWQSIEFIYQNSFSQSQTITKALYQEKRLTAAHRRYLQAIESLARVRGLLRRVPVQVNIAQQQVVQNG